MIVTIVVIGVLLAVGVWLLGKYESERVRPPPVDLTRCPSCGGDIHGKSLPGCDRVVGFEDDP